MKKADLHAKGGILPVTLVKRHVKWKSIERDIGGDPMPGAEEQEFEGDIFVKRLSYGLVDQIKNEDAESRSALILSKAVRLGERGEESLSLIEAMNLDPRLGQAMLVEVALVNRLPGVAIAKEEEGAADPKG